MKNKLVYLNFIGVIFYILTYNVAYADQKKQSITLQTIKVKARLWEEEIQETPVDTTIIPIDEQTNNMDINIIPQRVSNVTIEPSSVQTRVTIRGSSGLDGGLQDPVGYFINDVALPLGGNQLPALFNIKPIEVLKGPQGTLYGKNTEAGAIKLESLDPSWSLSGGAALSSGIVDGAGGNEPVNIMTTKLSNQLSDNKLAGAIAFRIEDSQGAYLNNANNSNRGGEVDNGTLSTGFTYVVGDNTDITLKSIVDKNDSTRNRFRFNSGVNRTERFTTNTNTEGFDNDRISVHSLKINHSFDTVELVSITGVTDYARDFAIDLDVTTAPLPATTLNLDNKSISEEIRLSSNTENSTIKWLMGLYVFDEESTIDFSISPMFSTTNRSTTIDQKGRAIFGQIDYQLAPQWQFSIGGRYERIEQSASQNLTSTMINASYSADINATEFLPKTSISYQPNKSDLVYLSYSEGYLPGGYNYNSAGGLNSFTFNPEYSSLIELGWKNIINKKVSSTVTLFKNTIEDKQIVDLLPGFIQSISNAGETETYGIELSSNFQIEKNIVAYANLGWQNSEAKSYITNTLGSVQDFSGNELPFAPERTYSLGIEYKKDSGLFGSLSLRGSGEYYFNSQNTLEQSGFAVVDTQIGYRFNKATLSLWANNITDSEVLSRAVNTQAGTVVEDMLPRTIGLTFSADL